MNKFDRVISTLVLLQTKRVIKAQTISERFDISTLKNAGIPIIGDPGIGYSIMDGYRMAPIMFNEGEATALLTAEKIIGKMTDQDTQAYFSSAMMKIKAILRSAEKQSLAILDDSIVISNTKNEESKAQLQDLFKSISAKQILNIEYKKADGSISNRNLESIGCYHQFNHWYLVAFCQLKNDYRTFKLNRIQNLKLLDQFFDKSHISLQDYIDQQQESWKEAQQFHAIEIVFSNDYVKFAESRKYYFGFVEQSVEPDGIHMKFLNSSLEVVARWLMQFGDQATVITPVILKERLRTLATQMFEHYK